MRSGQPIFKIKMIIIQKSTVTVIGAKSINPKCFMCFSLFCELLKRLAIKKQIAVMIKTQKFSKAINTAERNSAIP